MYHKLKEGNAPMVDCFFAFSDSQLQEGLKKINKTVKEVLNGGFGLVGTKEGIKLFYNYYEYQSRAIAEMCDPQKVYNYEFGNHECSYTNDDAEAIQIVVDYFGDERAKTVKRKFGYWEIGTKI